MRMTIDLVFLDSSKRRSIHSAVPMEVTALGAASVLEMPEQVKELGISL